MKKQRTFWLDNRRWNILQQKIFEQGFVGKGKLERFMEMIIDYPFFIVKGDVKVKITPK